MSLMHAAGCCCSACSDAVTINCCIKGDSVPAGECECDLLGGYKITAQTPCECSATIVSCCYEGNTLSLSDCDCKIIGGTSNPPTCDPNPFSSIGCDVCTQITIKSRPAIPQFFGCLRNSNTNAGPCVSIYGGSICNFPPFYPWGTELGMCWNYPECVTIIGNCITCSNGNTNCGLTGTLTFYEFTKTQYIGPCPASGVTTTTTNQSTCDTACCENPYIVLLTEKVIKTTTKKCGSFNLQSISAHSYNTDGSGCSQIDVNDIFASETLTPYTCFIPC